MMLPIVGCKSKTDNEVQSEAPTGPGLVCDSITLNDNDTDANIQNYCKVEPDGADITIGSFDLSVGEHELSYTVTDTETGGFATGTVKYNVKHHDVANAHWDDASNTYVANDGYVSMNGEFVAKAVCGDGTVYDEGTNSCIVAPTPEPEAPAPAQNNSSSNNSSNYSHGPGTQSFPVDTSSQNRQQAINDAFNACNAFCEAYGTCSCQPNNSNPYKVTAYTATYN
jgi:hypothetical protein